MACLKCKMCGGDLNIIDESLSVVECEYCGSKQTVPTVDDEKKLTLFARAGRLMRACEFDKAAGIFESIISDFPTEAEAYWGLVLSKYGIEYVDDPATGKKVPTCHRSSFESVMEDSDFDQACENADGVARRQYRDEAKQIEELRRGIIEVSASEQPYDIFISYKEKDETGERTLDSVLAQDIYDTLTQKGYRVFFSRISLEDKLGVEYEPYIFAALNSARVMLVVGTDYDYFNAVWVKNEWSRFLKLMAADKSKHLIPCFKGIDAYDMPKEFNKLTAQDLGKVGALQDLVRGIDKLTGKGEKAAESTVASPSVVQQIIQGATTAVESQIQRGTMALEDGEFKEAEEYFNKALDSNPRSAEAYLGLFMASISCRTKEEAKEKFVNDEYDYPNNRYWKRARQFATGDLASELETWEEERRVAEQKAEEERRLAAQKAEAEKIKLTEKLQPIEDELNSAESELNAFENKIQAEKNTLAEKNEELKKLGVFQKKEKDTLSKQIEELTEKLAEKVRKEESVISEQLAKIEASVSEIEKKLNEDNISSGTKIIQIKLKISTIKIGIGKEHTIKFGKYRQNKDSQPSPIEWIVLKKKNNSLLVISKYSLDAKPYNTEKADLTWETCSLRKWLNDSFINSAFSQEEQALIKTASVSEDKNPEYGTNSGSATTDKAFLLSINEVNEYFTDDEARKCVPTDYAVAHGARTSNSYMVGGKVTCWWWLRSPGYDRNYAAVVNDVGSVHYYGDVVDNDGDCVRPALWINLNS